MTKTNAIAHPSNVAGDMAVTIRRATADDAAALLRLAALDSGPFPQAALVAEVDGSIWAARSLSTGAAVADPFRYTAELVELLHERARHLLAEDPAPRRLSVAWLADTLRPRRHRAHGG